MLIQLEIETWGFPELTGFFIGNYHKIHEILNYDDRRILTMIHEIRYIRNRWAHSKTICTVDFLRLIDSIRILNSSKSLVWCLTLLF